MVPPFSGIRIVDMTNVVMGPLATQFLADFGADVIKIEPPEGDLARSVGPSVTSKMGPLFLHLNRNKRSVVLDCKRAEQRDLLLKLIETADVFTFNVRPNAMERLGLDYRTVLKINPRILYVGMVGFSQRGPHAAEAAFDDLIQAASGLAALNGAASPDKSPRYLPFNLADRMVGLYTFGVIAAALRLRDQTGRGQEISIPMYETMASLILGDHFYGETFQPPKGEMGYPRLLAASRRPFPTKDGYLCCLIYTDPQWRSFLGLIGKAGLFDEDPRFANIGARTAHIDFVYAFLADQLRERTTVDWMRVFKEAGLTAFPVQTIRDLPGDPQIAAAGLIQMTKHPSEGDIRLLGVPSEWSGWSPSTRQPPPQLGEHTDEVLREIGLSADDIKRLRPEVLERA